MKKLIATAVIASLLVGGTVGICAAEQPHMRAALEHLREAREQLERATPNKGGHREKAIELIDHAMKQVREGMEYSEHHERYEHR